VAVEAPGGSFDCPFQSTSHKTGSQKQQKVREACPYKRWAYGYCKIYYYFSENGIISDINVYDFYSVFGVIIIIINFTTTLHTPFVRTDLSHFLLFL